MELNDTATGGLHGTLHRPFQLKRKVEKKPFLIFSALKTSKKHKYNIHMLVTAETDLFMMHLQNA